MQIEPYRVFYHVGRLGSITRAAEELYTSQPAVSQCVKQLEERLGLQLFNRNSRGVTLTSEGQVLYEYVAKGYNLFLRGERAVADMAILKGGEIRIGGSDTLCKHFLLPILQQYNSKYPEVRIRVTNRTTPESLDLLRRGEVDLAVVHLPVEEKGFSVLEVKQIQDCVVAGERFSELANVSVSLAQLQNYPLMLLEKGTNTRRFLDQWAWKEGVSLSPEIELGSVDLLTEFARIGLGLAVVVRDFVLPELMSGKLFEVKLQESIPSRAIGLATYEGVPLSRAADEFLYMVLNSASRGENDDRR